MSALVPTPFQCVTVGTITASMRYWMDNVLGDQVDFDNRIKANVASIAANTSAIAANTTALALLRQQNVLIDGECQVAQGAVANLSTTPTYGQVDMWAAWASGGTVSAGTIAQAGGGGLPVQTDCAVLGATITGTGKISFRQRIESKIARSIALSLEQAQAIYGASATGFPLSASFMLRTNSGVNFNARVILRVPTAADNYAATTTLATSTDAIVLGDNSFHTAHFDNIVTTTADAIQNGLEIELQCDVGAISSKFLLMTQAQLVLAKTAPTVFVSTPFDVQLARVQRYYQKSFAYETAPATGAGTAGMQIRECVLGSSAVNGRSQVTLHRPMRANPTVTFYNPTSANALWYNLSRSGDSGAASVPFPGTRSFIAQQTQVVADAAGQICGIHWTADARL